MHMKELPEKRYENNHATVVLWIDDKLREGDSVIKTL